MEKNYQFLNMDINKPITRKLTAMQFDSKSRYILVSVFSNFIPYDLSNTTVKIYGVKGDKKEFFNNATIIDAKAGKFEIELTEQCLAAVGDVEIQILILGVNKERLSSNSFILNVKKTLINPSKVVSQDEWRILTEGLASLAEYDVYKNNVTRHDVEIKKNKDKIDSIVTYNIQNEGAKGDGEFDNARVFQEIFSKISDYENIYIPKGIFKVKLTNDMRFIHNGHSLLNIENKKGIKITGKGSILLDTSDCTQKNWFMMFSNCQNIQIEGITIIGDAIFSSSKVVSDSYPNGFVFENCKDIKFTNNTMMNMLACLSTTGSITSPASTNDVSYDTIISNNLFKNYGQISTYGGGASRLVFSNNICVNSIQSSIKLSSNPQLNENTVGNSYDNLITGNLFTWEKEFGFGVVGWDNSKRYAPVAIMLECHCSLVNISNNTIDMSNITQNIENPVQSSGGIVIFKGNSNTQYFYKNIDILNNTIKSYKDKEAILITQCVKNININGNSIHGTVVMSNVQLELQLESLSICNNTIYGIDSYAYLDINANHRKIDINNNILNSNYNGDYKSIIELNDIKSETLNIISNSLEDGNITSYSKNTLNINKINISNNFFQQVSLFTHSNTKNVNICGNSIYSKLVAFKLVSNNINTFYNITGNCGTIGGAIELNQGKVRLDGNSFATNSANPFNFGENVTLNSGVYWGNGVPTLNALFGCFYIDYSTTVNATYIKTTVSGNGGWKKIATI